MRRIREFPINQLTDENAISSAEHSRQFAFAAAADFRSNAVSYEMRPEAGYVTSGVSNPNG